MAATSGNGVMTFWDHLDELRGGLLRSLVVYCLVSAVLFFFKGFLFDSLVLAPTRGDFFLYRWLGVDVHLDLVNIEMTAQFMSHIKVSLVAALIASVPYFLYEIWRFVAPALYEGEKRAAAPAFAFSAILFWVGICIGYTLVLPLMVKFFQDYRVSDAVDNVISLSSYMSTVASTVLLFGLTFEVPVLLALLSRIGLVTRGMLVSGWRYAVLTVVVLAALITPSGDPFSLFVVSLPLFLLYLISIAACRDRKEVDG